MTPGPGTADGRGSVPVYLLRAVAVIGLAIDVYVHLRLAPVFDQVGTQVTQGQLFRAEAVLAAVAAGYLGLSDSRRAWLCAGGVAVGGAAAVLLTHYVDVTALGPLPDLSDPLWSADKVTVLVAVLVTTLAWGAREILRARRGAPAKRRSSVPVG